MNEFTKEELQYLAECTETEIKYYGESHLGHGLLDKLQSMIDNYCEHDFDEYPTLERYVRECKHCGREETR